MRIFLLLVLFSLNCYATDWVKYVQSRAKTVGVDPIMAYAIGKIESNFNPDVPSRFEPKFKTYSVGMFQLFYPTALSMGFMGSVKDLQNPKTNIEYGLKYLKKCQKYEDVGRIACCYNAGIATKDSVCNNNKSVKEYIIKVEQFYLEGLLLGQSQ